MCVKSGVYNNLEAQIKNLEENAKYMRCAMCNVNPVLNYGVKGVAEVANFVINILDSICQFFNATVRRWSLLQNTGTDVPSQRLKNYVYPSRLQEMKH